MTNATPLMPVAEHRPEPTTLTSSAPALGTPFTIAHRSRTP